MPKGDVGYDIHKRAVELNKGALKPYEKQEKTKAKIKERGGPPGYPDKSKTVRSKPMGEAYSSMYQENMSAFDKVKADIEKKYGKGAIIDTKAPKKEMSPEDKKKDVERRAKNYADNNKGYNPYKPRAGESD